uniref:Rieske domain-containing protein n=1 Tax=Physcomitrium patens TaxID=3218 RepID=A0A7I4A6C1_PHYPA
MRAAMVCTASFMLEVSGPVLSSRGGCQGVQKLREARGLGASRVLVSLRRRSIGGRVRCESNSLSVRGAKARDVRLKAVADSEMAKVSENPMEVEFAGRVEAEGESAVSDGVEYDWEKEWYPMYLTDEMPKAAPLGLTVFDRQLVLFYDDKGELNCFEDRCPHRLAKLSEGKMTDGKLECLYHGWQFEGSGQCTKIPQVFEVTERTSRGFAGIWKEISSPEFTNTTRFEAPCCLRNDKVVDKPDGSKDYLSAVFLCRPSGQGKSMLIVRFGSTKFPDIFKKIPGWFLHKTSNTVFEQDMGFLASQNAYLVKKNQPTKDLYLNLKSSDTWVSEFRKWNDRVGRGMPYYFGHQTTSAAINPAILEAAPAGFSAAAASSYPAQGSFGEMFARDPTNRYFRHVVHCKSCLKALNNFQKFQKVGIALGLIATGVAITLSSVMWRASFVTIALLAFATSYACSRGVAALTVNYVRPHRKGVQ